MPKQVAAEFILRSEGYQYRYAYSYYSRYNVISTETQMENDEHMYHESSRGQPDDGAGSGGKGNKRTWSAASL